MDKNPAIYLAQPTYDGTLNAKAQNAVMDAIVSGHVRATDPVKFSLLAANCNGLWCNCLNRQKEYGHTHFMMLHNDIVPELGFAKKMLDIMKNTGAHILSAAVPFKNNSGLTSTALEQKPKAPRRLTMKELADLPHTFDIHDCRKYITQDATCLLANTGLMLVDLSFQNVRQLYFDEENWIEEKPDGTLGANVLSEDWFFTRLAFQFGAKVMVTRSVKAEHVGEAEYANYGTWGQEIDVVNL